MIVVDLDGTIAFGHSGGPVCHKTHVAIDDESDVVMAFNASSSLYDERNYILTGEDEIAAWEKEHGKRYEPPPSLFRPFGFSRWYMYNKKVEKP